MSEKSEKELSNKSITIGECYDAIIELTKQVGVMAKELKEFSISFEKARKAGKF